MTGRKTTSSNNMDIVINRLSGDFFRGLEKTSNIYIKSEVSESTGDDLSSTVVAILTHFSN